MVAKKTAVQQPASATSTDAPGGAAEDGKAVTAVRSVRSSAAAGTKKRAAKASAKAEPAKTAATKSGASPKDAAADDAARETAGKQVAVEETAGKAAAKRTTARKTASKRAAASKPAAGRATAEKATARKATGAKSVAATSAGSKNTAKKVGAASAAEQTGATTVVAKKTPGTATAAKTAVPKARLAAAEPGELAVRPGEEPWTLKEVEEARTELDSEQARLRAELAASEAALTGLMRDSGDGAGDDQADTGTKNITREHELALAANAREMLIQTEHALERLDAGTYGLCENCGNAIGKARMQAFPRATLCVECKQKQERRY
ncbi:DNA-binding protein [Streptomyces sp. P3]|uniref:TraR/DksA C4-type zinc finger protein n=1 Tax=Streptomyces sp. P3 TaxID=2135430 RepID=UPI000D1B752E|nr:TraR/DksA family transcriptional regulator [Streptomyces sp. P3]AVV43151.1 DNA-binding protein [Streptomyces sp. P3]